MNRKCLLTVCLLVLISVTGCNKETPSSTENRSSDENTVDDHADGGGHEGHGLAIDLGTATIADWTIRAARDEGAVSAGSEVPADVWLTDGTGKVSAVRFWIGTEDAKGSVKALAAIEDPADQTHWHTHVEIPRPLPDGSRLWVELQDDSGVKNVASFELKM